ncbi:MAG: hypothetical protein ACIALR_09690 [Blastopirellula sp. JB062]
MKSFVFLAIGLLCIGCSNGVGEGEPKYPVEGVIRINGEPAHRVAVTFHHDDATLPSSKRFATGVTNEEGRFELSTEGDRDGAIAGRYVVTFTWLSANDISAYDMLGGKFSSPATSEFDAVIPQTPKGDLQFDLSVSADQIRSPRAAR